ncbi:hypothetical protein [Lysinibacillus sp. Ag94]|uniref:hypothetical protein n=1 Tax=Lysinibacillus sp. Ag94 TaxID=2936682 RepID=UPI00200D37AB|nr:hypothetical protein [Lysinibacillus sp. Ag94]UPW83953.1 hypothetical protein MY533_03495 [Lysinibacillus sp. Ag94]
MGMSDRGIKAKTITPYDKAFVTNIVLLLSLRCTTLSRQKHLFRPKFWSVVDVVCAKAKRQQHVFACAKAKRQQHDFFCAKAKRQQHVFFCAKAKRQQHVLSVRKASPAHSFFYYKGKRD